MKIRVEGQFEGKPAHLEWEDGTVEGSSERVRNLSLCIAHINSRRGFPTPDQLVELEDWMSHPRGFLLCAEEALENASTDWVDEEMPDRSLWPMR